MSSRKSKSITISELPARQIAALRREAKRMGIPPEDFVKTIIADALEARAIAAKTSFRELTKPFEKALAGLSEAELIAMSRLPRKKTKH